MVTHGSPACATQGSWCGSPSLISGFLSWATKPVFSRGWQAHLLYDIPSLDAGPSRCKNKNESCLITFISTEVQHPISLLVCETISEHKSFSLACFALSFFLAFPFFLYKSALNPVFPEGNVRKHRVMLCFPRERHFLHYSPVSFQALHRSWTNINDSFISSGPSPEAGLFVELKIAIINKKLASLPPHCALKAYLGTAQCCRETWLRVKWFEAKGVLC